jgi:hypothetical protein
MFKRLTLTALFVITAIVLATYIAKAQVPGLVEVSGFVCKDQLSAEAIGVAYEKGGADFAQQMAEQLLKEEKCGNLKETMWATEQHIKMYSHLGKVIRLYSYDISGTAFYGLQDHGEILA